MSIIIQPTLFSPVFLFVSLSVYSLNLQIMQAAV